MKVRELLQEINLWDDNLEVFVPAPGFGEPLPTHEWEYVYAADDPEGRGEPIGVLLHHSYLKG